MTKEFEEVTQTEIQPVAQVIIKKRDGSEDIWEVPEDGHVIVSVATLNAPIEDDEVNIAIKETIMATPAVRRAMIESLIESDLAARRKELDLPEGLSKLLDALEKAISKED